MRKTLRFSVGTYVIFGLMVIGILFNLTSFQGWIIPTVILLLVYVLYRFPPRRGTDRRYQAAARRTTAQKQHKSNKRVTMFRVIKGNKDDNDDTPRYH